MWQKLCDLEHLRPKLTLQYPHHWAQTCTHINVHKISYILWAYSYTVLWVVNHRHRQFCHLLSFPDFLSLHLASLSIYSTSLDSVHSLPSLLFLLFSHFCHHSPHLKVLLCTIITTGRETWRVKSPCRLLMPSLTFYDSVWQLRIISHFPSITFSLTPLNLNLQPPI